MARFHVSQSVPTKHEAIAAWLPTQPWSSAIDDGVAHLGSFHFDDPEGEVGMETHLLEVAGELVAVPVTYRSEPLPGREDALVGTIEHSVLGTRWIHDGLADDRYVTLLAATALTGQGPALGLALHDGRWFAAPSELRIDGGGWSGGPFATDGFEVVDRSAAQVLARSDRFELVFFRRPEPAERPDMGLLVAAPGSPEPVVLASVTALR